MTAPIGAQRFFATTRGRLTALLRRADMTVEELAQELDLTDNAVRAHLATLERDGLVEQRGARRGAGKPAFLYGLSVEGERLFPKAYEPVLRRLLDTLDERQPEQVPDLLRATGRAMAHGIVTPGGPLEVRLRAATQALNSLGGIAEMREYEREYAIEGQRCPLATLVPDHPHMCQLAESLVSELAGVVVSEQCDRGESPRCRFVIAKPQ